MNTRGRYELASSKRACMLWPKIQFLQQILVEEYHKLFLTYEDFNQQGRRYHSTFDIGVFAVNRDPQFIETKFIILSLYKLSAENCFEIIICNNGQFSWSCVAIRLNIRLECFDIDLVLG